ncbi:unnamed protein product, partial [Polarella glacialis]
VVHGDVLYRSSECLELNDAQRILRARSPFEVLQIPPDGPVDEKQVRTAYRKLALRVHPDKRSQEEDLDSFNQAFTRLETAKEAIESMLSADVAACRELHRVLHAEVHRRDVAADLLGVDGTATYETQQVAEEAEKASKKGIAKLAKMEHIASADHERAVAIYKEAIETLRRPASKEALPRQEALLRQPMSTSRALGARDMRFPAPVLAMKPESVSWHVPRDKAARVALLCGSTADLTDQQLTSSSSSFKRCPKASALRWCQESTPSASSCMAACLRFEARVPGKDDGSAKRQKTAAGQPQKAGTIFLRHILLRHLQLRVLDPSARREGTAKGPGDAEALALATLQELL